MPIGIKPEGDKVMRMEAQSARFEAGQVYLPEQAPWLATLLHEILGFPKGQHDDQLDSVSQFLNWAESVRRRELRELEYVEKAYGGRPLVYVTPDGTICIG